MRDKPKISEDRIALCLLEQYSLAIIIVRFLPIGYDLNAFVFEAVTIEGTAYFVKIRADAINPASLIVPRLLIEHQIPNILAPLRTKSGDLWCSLDSYSVIVFPFVRGENAMVTGMSEQQWRAFGSTLNTIHSGTFATLLKGQVPEETFGLPSAESYRQVSASVDTARSDNPSATRLAAFWNENRVCFDRLVDRAEALGRELQSRPFEKVLCHADIHAANILVSDSGGIYLVDWDGPLLAPRERDLLFVVGSTIARRVLPHEEEWFFAGYGAREIDRTALAYYRYERIIEDIGVCGENVFSNPEMSEEAKEGEVDLIVNLFQPGQIVESALDLDEDRS